MNYKQAMASPDKDKWQEALEQEFKQLEDLKVWTPVSKKDVGDVNVVDSTWVFKKKSNGRYKARLVLLSRPFCFVSETFKRDQANSPQKHRDALWLCGLLPL